MKKEKEVIQTKKVYTGNKILLKRLLKFTIIAFIIILAFMLSKNALIKLYLNTWTWRDIESYDLSVKIQRAYKETSDSSQKLDSINISNIKSEANVEIKNEYVIEKPETVYEGRNILNGINLKIQCLSTPKTTKTLDELAESTHALIGLYYEDKYDIGDLQKEYLTALESDAIKAIVDISNSSGTETFVIYMIPTKDKEVTVTFLGDKTSIESSMSDIDKLISNMK